MATRTQSRTPASKTRRSSTTRKAASQARSTETASRADERSAFSFDSPNAGALVGAALAGAAIGFAANYGRKFLMQGVESMTGDWDEMLAVEHDAALAIFDRMLDSEESQTFKRKMLLMKLTHALDKHAHQEEMIVYPALRDAGIRVEADQLEVEHGEVKTFLYKLGEMDAGAPEWLQTVREFRSLISRHAHMEEEEVFPSFKAQLDADQNARITKLVNRDGFWMA